MGYKHAGTGLENAMSGKEHGRRGGKRQGGSQEEIVDIGGASIAQLCQAHTTIGWRPTWHVTVPQPACHRMSSSVFLALPYHRTGRARLPPDRTRVLSRQN